MKLLQKEGVLVPEKENTSSWKRFWQNIGLARKTSPATSLEGITKEKKRLEIKLEEENKKLLNIALELSFDEQTHRKWETTEKKMLQLEEKTETEEE